MHAPDDNFQIMARTDAIANEGAGFRPGSGVMPMS
jgi:2-methylisocitrate lyase-like PEP mutase family enzyme